MSALAVSHTGRHTQEGQNVPTFLVKRQIPLHFMAPSNAKRGKLFLGLSLLPSAYEETRGQPSKTSYPGPAMRKAFPTSDKEQVGRIDICQSVGWRQTSKIIAHIYRELIMARHCPICPHILCYLILTTSDKVGAVQSYPWFTDEETGF